MIVQLVLPAFNMLIGTTLKVPYDRALFWVSAFGFVLSTVCCGQLSAFISRRSSRGYLPEAIPEERAVFSPRRVLVVLHSRLPSC